MKVQFAENNVLSTGGLGVTQSFQIRTNAHAFKMLSSGLYSDKIGAVLREIGCNAHDAHIGCCGPTQRDAIAGRDDAHGLDRIRNQIIEIARHHIEF